MIACVPPHGESPASRSMSPCSFASEDETEERLLGRHNERWNKISDKGRRRLENRTGATQPHSWSGTAVQMIRAQGRIKLPPLHTPYIPRN